MTVGGLRRLLSMLGDKVLPDVREHVERVLESCMVGDAQTIQAVASA